MPCRKKIKKKNYPFLKQLFQFKGFLQNCVEIHLQIIMDKGLRIQLSLKIPILSSISKNFQFQFLLILATEHYYLFILSLTRITPSVTGTDLQGGPAYNSSSRMEGEKLGGPPIRRKFCQSPPSDTCPRFWTKACPSQLRFVPENLKNLFEFIFVSNLTTSELKKSKSTLKSCISCLK